MITVDGYKNMNMKKLIYILTATAALMALTWSCQKSESGDSNGHGLDMEIVGDWHLSETMSEHNPDIEMPDVYLRINPDGSFELYQKSGTQSLRHDLFTGTCSTKDGILSGTYSSGHPWASKWEYEFVIDGMILTSFNLLEVNRYVRTEIPEDVIKNANRAETRSSCRSCTPIL